MSTTPPEDRMFCIFGEHSKADRRTELDQERAKLLKLNKELVVAKRDKKPTEALESEIKISIADVAYLKDLIENEKWIPISEHMLEPLAYKQTNFVLAIENAIKKAVDEKDTIKAEALKTLLEQTIKSLAEHKKHLKSEAGAQYICQSCFNQIANKLGLTSGTQNLPAVIEPSKGNLAVSIDDLPMPLKIRQFLNDYIIGQDLAKVVISSVVALQYRRLQLFDEGKRDKMKRSNVLLIGPTGSGKTALMKTLQMLLKDVFGIEIPMSAGSATKYSEAGYVGGDVEELIKTLVSKAYKTVVMQATLNKEGTLDPQVLCERVKALTERGIVHIDEIDKIANRGGFVGDSVSRGGVQNALLTMLDGCLMQEKIPAGEGKVYPIEIDTTKILFFGSGAFAGSAELDSIYDIANKRQGGVAQTNTQSGIGFITAKAEANPKNYESGVQDVEASDVVEYGLMSEITGRFTNIVTLSELSLDALRSIMTEPKDAELPGLIEDLKDFYNIDLEFDDEAMMEMAKLAKARKTGARAIPSVVNAIIFVISGFPEEYAGKKVIINKEAITDVSKMLVVDPETGKKIGKVIPVAEQVIATDEAKAEATSDENKPADEKPSSKE